MSKAKVRWPDEIDLPGNWDEGCPTAGNADDVCCACDDEGEDQHQCVSMFLGRRLGVLNWADADEEVARARLVRLGFTKTQARALLCFNDSPNGGTKAAIRMALELKGYDVPA